MDVNINRIPKEMVQLEQWICWDERIIDGDDRKIPIDPMTESQAKTNDPSTWGSFMQANGTYKSADLDGIGFIFTEEDPYVGIDLDDCRDPETGEWDEWALETMQEIGGWIEISTSGTGAHIIVKGELPGSKNRKGDVEMYETTRYFAITGNLVDENGEPLDEDDETPEIKEAQDGIDTVYDRFLGGGDEPKEEIDIEIDSSEWEHTGLESGKGSSIRGSLSGPSLDVLDPEVAELVKKAKGARNGYKFTQLWRGDWQSVYPGESQSEADLGFCDMLAFWMSGDPERIDQVFRASGLMRPKWDEDRGNSTYGELTISKALSRVSGYYDSEYYESLSDDSESTDSETESETHTAEERVTEDGNDGSGAETSPAQNNPDNSDNDTTSSVNTPPSRPNQNVKKRRRNQSRRQRQKHQRRASDRPKPDDSDRTTRNSQSDKGDSVTPASDNSRSSNRRRKKGDQAERRVKTVPDHVKGRFNRKNSHQVETDRRSTSDPASDTNSEPNTTEKSNSPVSSESAENTESNSYVESSPSSEEETDTQDEHQTVTESSIPDLDVDDDDVDYDMSVEEADSMFNEEEYMDSDNSDTDDTENSDETIDLTADTSSSKSSSDDRQSDESVDVDVDIDVDNDSKRANASSGSTSKDSGNESKEDDDKNEPKYVSEQKFTDLQGEVKQLNQLLRKSVGELQGDLILEKDQFVQLIKKQEEIESNIQRLEDRFNTIHQILLLMCYTQPEPIFEKIEGILLSQEEIPEDNVFEEDITTLLMDPDLADQLVMAGEDPHITTGENPNQPTKEDIIPGTEINKNGHREAEFTEAKSVKSNPSELEPVDVVDVDADTNATHPRSKTDDDEDGDDDSILSSLF